MRNVSDKRYRENQNTHLHFYEIMVEAVRPLITAQHGAYPFMPDN